jgi:pimeloyl-ACP methyl ester carboxylesterase
MRKLPLLIAAAVLAALPSTAAAQDDAPLVPLLTGGLLTYSGSASVVDDWSWRTPNGWPGPPAGGGKEDIDKAGQIAFETSWLVEGRYPGVPVATAMQDITPAWQYRVELGSGTDAVRGQVHAEGPPPLTTNYGRDCAWSITLDEAPLAAPMDETGRTYQLSPILGREEHETACSENESAPDVFVGFETDPIEQYESLPAELAKVARTGERAVSLDRRRTDCGDGIPVETTRCDHAISGAGRIVTECALCVDELRYEHPDLPGGAWQRVPAAGTYDGNRVRITALVRNATKKTITAPVALRDMTHGRALTAEGLPASIAVAPGATVEVVGEWDSDGFAWEHGPGTPTLDHEIAFLTPYGAAQKLLKIKPKPAVLVHGWASDASTWGAYPGFLKGHSPEWESLAVSTMDTDPGGSRSVFANAEALAGEVRRLRESTDADHVDIIAHSMGGLISRAYIHRSVGKARDGKPWVHRLVMLGTPNEGSPCANLVYPVMSGRPTLELTPGYVKATFNKSVRNRKGVPFSIVAGTDAAATCYEPMVGDLVVTVPSAFWEVGDRGTMKLLHTSMTGSQAMFDGFVAPRLEVGPGGGGAKALADRAARAGGGATADAGAGIAATGAGGAQPQVVATRRVTLRGKRISVPVRGERNATLTAVAMADDGVTMELVAPGGKVVGAVRAGSEQSRELIRALRAKSRPGRWAVRLSGRGAAAVSVGIGGGAMKLSATARQRKAGARVAIRAKLRRAGRGARVRAVVRGASGRPVTVKLRRRGGAWRGATRTGVAGAAAGIVVTARAGGRQRIVAVVARR